MKSKMELVLMLLLMMSLAGAQNPSPPVTQQTLQQVAGSLQMYVDPLPNMPKIYGYSMQNGSPKPVTLTIGMYQKTWKFHRDLPPTPVFAFGTSAKAATFPGPTIIARQGVPLSVTWQNHLPSSHILPWDPTVPTAIPKNGGVPTVVHLHGSVHPPVSDGSALAWFTANFQETGPKWTQATYTYPNVQPPGNLWYHDHALGLTRANLLAGLLGAYVIQNPSLDEPFNLPCGDQFDRHLIIADRSFNVDGTLFMNATGVNPSIHPQWQPEYFGEAITVNGKAWPFLAVHRRKYRFRIINSSNARYIRLALSNGLAFCVIGSDASYLAAPVTSQNILLAPAETADVIVDFSLSTTNEAVLTNDAPYPYPTGSPVGPLNGKVMKFVILPKGTPPEDPDNSTVPTKEGNFTSVVPTDVALTRYITMYEYTSATGSPTHLYINGKRFEDPVTETPTSGTTELWNVINLTGDNHPLHIHLGVFQAIKVQELVDLTTFKNCMTAINDAVKCNVAGHAVGKVVPVPAEHEKTWKNVVKIDPGYMTSVVVAFKLVETNQKYPFDATGEPGYVYHCHILDHEDKAMIRPMKMLP
ncbi:LOW QUALITY PROTEIN: multicopper oxidase LPR1 homolog 4-like [Phoenix dactylifera]|uniref:LOW QUALITY PROTEIN: multicopper oxidase LPR1 homolog 4-like n=1 Tax=Phoenix dactylifera TaxID=42345 RepID=A0A8B9AII3_PHODC|nr:LOW QUALITY PROTEIN: multicopper oxidase LPR1 homolog 4-like [Phoenix dactylifera]